MLRTRSFNLLNQSLSFSKLPNFIYTLSFQTHSNLNPTKSPILRSTTTKKTSKFLVLHNSEITKNGRNGNLKEAESIFNRLPIKNVITWTAMLTAYADNGWITKARKLFDEMPQRNTATWNAMVTAYIRNNLRIGEAYELFCQIPERNSVSYATMITGFVRSGMLLEAQRVYSEMPMIGRDPVVSNVMIDGYLKSGELEKAVGVFEGMVERDVVSWSSMLDGYCKNGDINKAEELFQKMTQRNVVSWTTMISGYMRIGQWEDGFRLFLTMRRDEDHVNVNSTTLTMIFETCGNVGRWKEGIQVHGLIFSMGFEFDLFLGNSIINFYCRMGCMGEATNLFNMMKKKDIVSWNSMIAGFVQNDQIEAAYSFFKKMQERDVVSWTTMISGFSNKGRIENSVELFNEMPTKDDIAWTAIISGFVSNGEYEEAFWLFVRMIREGIRPNFLTVSSIISASSSLATLNLGEQVHAYVVKMNTGLDLSIQNSLVAMYSKCGNVGDAYKIFSSIRTPNVVSMNSMITGFSLNGFGNEALELFKKMQMEGHEPNQITFLGVLSACVHGGLLEEGWNYFKSMSSVHNIEPEADHYACMVDLLGRSGFLKEALNLIQSMPMRPHSGVWGALLSASRTHMDVDLARLAAGHLFELEPDNATPYVVLSNIYAVAGLQMDEKELRMAKKSKGVTKSPGCSWIVVND